MHEEKSLRSPHKTESQDEVYQPRAEQQKRAWNTMRWFDGTPKTQAGFYARYQEMTDEDIMFLKCFYDIADDWDLFKMICKFWNVPIISRRAAVATASTP
jgi:hypothetical protein